MFIFMSLKYVHSGIKNNSLRIMKMDVPKELIAKNVMDGKNMIFTIKFIKLNNVLKFAKFPGIVLNIIKMNNRESHKNRIF